MKRKLLLIAAAFLGLALFSCQKDDPVVDDNETKIPLFATYDDPQFDVLIGYMNMPRPDDSYNYNLSNWQELTLEERRAISQVPVEQLQSMSTQAVLQALWEYPFLYELTSSLGRNIQVDFDNAYRQGNNAFKELLLRDDAAQCLLLRVKLMDGVSREFYWNPLMFELIFSQTEMLNSLSGDEKKELLSECMANADERIEAGLYQNYEVTTSLLLARVMVNDNYSPFVDAVAQNSELNYFLENSGMASSNYGQIVTVIVEHATNYVGAE